MSNQDTSSQDDSGYESNNESVSTSDSDSFIECKVVMNFTTEDFVRDVERLWDILKDLKYVLSITDACSMRVFGFITLDYFENESTEYWIDYYCDRCTHAYLKLPLEKRDQYNAIECFGLNELGAECIRSIPDTIFHQADILYWIRHAIEDRKTIPIATDPETPDNIYTRSDDNEKSHWILRHAGHPQPIPTADILKRWTMLSGKSAPQHYVVLFHTSSRSNISKILHGSKYTTTNAFIVWPGIKLCFGSGHQDFSDRDAFYLVEDWQVAKMWAETRYGPECGIIAFLVDLEWFNVEPYCHLDFDRVDASFEPQWKDMVTAYMREGTQSDRVIQYDQTWTSIRGNMVANPEDILNPQEDASVPLPHDPPKKQWAIKHHALANKIFDARVVAQYWSSATDKI